MVSSYRLAICISYEKKTYLVFFLFLYLFLYYHAYTFQICIYQLPTGYHVRTLTSSNHHLMFRQPSRLQCHCQCVFFIHVLIPHLHPLLYYFQYGVKVKNKEKHNHYLLLTTFPLRVHNPKPILFMIYQLCSFRSTHFHYN